MRSHKTIIFVILSYYMVFGETSENTEKHKGDDYTSLPRESLFSNFFLLLILSAYIFLLKNGMQLIAFF